MPTKNTGKEGMVKRLKDAFDQGQSGNNGYGETRAVWLFVKDWNDILAVFAASNDMEAVKKAVEALESYRKLALTHEGEKMLWLVDKAAVLDLITHHGEAER